MTKRELLALMAVLHGCVTNKKLIPYGAIYFNRKTGEHIKYEEAACIIADFLKGYDKLIKKCENVEPISLYEPPKGNADND